MTKRRSETYLNDILESIDFIRSYLEGVSEAEFYRNVEKQDAVLRRLEVIGEAVKGVSPDIRSKYPEVPWRRIAGMRDVIIHEYFGVTLAMIWVVATRDIHDIERMIRQILSSEQE